MISTRSAQITLMLIISIPWLLSQFLAHHPVLSYLIAFCGSFFVFYMTILSPYRCLSPDRSLIEQIMRPLILIQLVFAGFMCCTSIFYFADHLGFEYLKNIRYNHFQVNDQTYLLAKCQRMALLGHIALVSGMIFQVKIKNRPKYILTLPLTHLLIGLNLFTLLLVFLLRYIPGFLQLKFYLLPLAVSCQAYLLILGIFHKKPIPLLFGGVFFAFYLVNATLTGYKEILLINLITLSFLAFPYFKKIITILFLPILYLLLYTLPTLTTIIRVESWTGGRTAQAARTEAFETLINGNNNVLIKNNNWEFLTNRLSEIGMITQYIDDVPDQRPYYGFSILTNSLYSLIPRTLWPKKPNTEKISMERVYNSRVVNKFSPVSAKTRPVIDGYLSGGLTVVFLSMFFYGLISQWICNKAEELFGGYELGCMIVFNSIFQQLWRGNNWEFLINNIVYGLLLIVLLFFGLKHLNVLKLNSL